MKDTLNSDLVLFQGTSFRQKNKSVHKSVAWNVWGNFFPCSTAFCTIFQTEQEGSGENSICVPGDLLHFTDSQPSLGSFISPMSKVHLKRCTPASSPTLHRPLTGWYCRQRLHSSQPALNLLALCTNSYFCHQPKRLPWFIDCTLDSSLSLKLKAADPHFRRKGVFNFCSDTILLNYRKKITNHSWMTGSFGPNSSY